MACGAMGSTKDIATLLQPFEERAQLAEERLAKLESVAQHRQGSSGQDDLVLNSLIEFRKKLVAVKTEHDAEKKKLIDENKKLQYQVLHLKRAVNEADEKLAKLKS